MGATHRTSPDYANGEVYPPLAPHWYSETEALAYRTGYMEGLYQGNIETLNDHRRKK